MLFKNQITFSRLSFLGDRCQNHKILEQEGRLEVSIWSNAPITELRHQKPTEARDAHSASVPPSTEPELESRALTSCLVFFRGSSLHDFHYSLSRRSWVNLNWGSPLFKTKKKKNSFLDSPLSFAIGSRFISQRFISHSPYGPPSP